jgi:TolA-binding protein
MKWRAFFLIALLFTFRAPAEDAATEERLNQLNGKIEDLIAGQEAQRKRISELLKEIESVRDSQSKPNNSASQEDLKKLAEAVKEVDRKRLEDYDKIRADILKLRDVLTSSPGPSRRPTPQKEPKETRDAKPPKDSELTSDPGKNPGRPEKGYEYLVKDKDTLSSIIQAYRAEHINVTLDQVLKANPGLKPEKMHIGQKIFIPAPEK